MYKEYTQSMIHFLFTFLIDKMKIVIIHVSIQYLVISDHIFKLGKMFSVWNLVSLLLSWPKMINEWTHLISETSSTNLNY